MKTLMIIALLCIGSFAFAEDLRLRTGEVYKNVIIISADPERMLIVHDGGGCQVTYAALASDSLTEQQRKSVEEGLRTYAQRKVRLEKLQMEKDAFELAQLGQGLILFEGNWMKPADRQELLANRDAQELALERLRIDLEKQKVELQKEQLLAEQERRKLEGSPRTYLFYSSSPSYSGYSHRYTNDRWSPAHWNSCGSGISFYGGGGSVSFSGRSSSSTRNFNRGSGHKKR
ncbi:hypothetical protein [Pontiella sulfatireligans]|uniref:Uncharacterized protein n=1 Tax=Pontiella sulfatireligans TaxID=2750658 RepID=A0A6C2UE32_9BACT|nr:hypothetical protein [Pontiella sulfatireligans]VGO18472.1 hypothetical protein SCARR_00525 [Pontiella sulfatireligans]